MTKEQDHRGTAHGAAMMRAAHIYVDDPPSILEDSVALSLIGTEYREVFRQLADSLRQLPLRAIRAVIVIRNRYAEDLLAEAMARGVTQYVILSAGLDSFAYRRRDLQPSLQVYEVDLPDPQESKRRRLAEIGIEIPGNVVYVPLDLEMGDLQKALAASGFRSQELAFFSWLGATEYLAEGAVYKTLRDVVSSAAPGSEIVFQYILPRSLVAAEDLPMWEFGTKTCADQGEPWISLFEPDRLVSQLRHMGYDQVQDLPAKEAFERYTRGRSDGFCPHNATHLIRARVGPKD